MDALRLKFLRYQNPGRKKELQAGPKNIVILPSLTSTVLLVRTSTHVQ